MLTQMAIVTLVSLPFCYEKNILGCLIGLRRKMRETLNQAAPSRPGADRLARTRYGASPRHATPSRTADTSEMFIIVTGIYGVQGFLGEIIVPNKLKCQVLLSSIFLFGSISDGGISTGCPNVLGFFFRNFSWEYLFRVFIPLVPPKPLSFSSPFVPWTQVSSVSYLSACTAPDSQILENLTVTTATFHHHAMQNEVFRTLYILPAVDHIRLWGSRWWTDVAGEKVIKVLMPAFPSAIQFLRIICEFKTHLGEAFHQVTNRESVET